jgi:hypothetical protein
MVYEPLIVPFNTPPAQSNEPPSVAVKSAKELGAIVALPWIVPLTVALVPEASGATLMVTVPVTGNLKPASTDAACCPEMFPA